MAMKKSNIVEPLSRAGFRKHILKSLSIQGAFVFALFLLKDVFQPKFIQNGPLIFCGVVFALNVAFTWFVFEPQKYLRRFKDIYPRHELSANIIFLSILMPAIFFALTIFLCVKEREETLLPSHIFRPRYFAVTLVLVFGVQSAVPLLSYWVGSPSVSYIVNTIHQANRILKFKDKVQVNANVYAEYKNKYSESLSPTEVVLLSSISAAHNIKEKNRKVASVHFSVETLESFHKALVLSESTKVGFKNFGPLQWVAPTGPLEIILLTEFDNRILNHFNKVILERSLQIVERVERKFRDSKDENDQKVLAQLKEIEQKLKSTNTYLALNEVTPI
jgi:hypothetical protein